MRTWRLPKVAAAREQVLASHRAAGNRSVETCVRLAAANVTTVT